MNNHKTQPNKYTNNKPTVWNKPPTRWQRLTCKHYNLQPVYTSIDQEAGDYQVHVAHYLCLNCGRKRYSRHQRVNPLVPLLLIALAILISYWFLT